MAPNCPVLLGPRDPLTNEFLPENTIERVLFSTEPIHLYHIPDPISQLASSAGLIGISSAAISGVPSARAGPGSSRLPSGGSGRPSTGPAIPARGPTLAVASRSRPVQSGGHGAPTPNPDSSIRASRWTSNPQDHIFEGKLRVVEYMIPVSQERLQNDVNTDGKDSSSPPGDTIYLTNIYILFETSSSSGSQSTLFTACQYVQNRIRESGSVPVTEVDNDVVQQASDSSRFFAVKVFADPEGRKKKTIGLGFEDREAAFEFSVVLQDVARRVEDAGGVNLGKMAAQKAFLMSQSNRGAGGISPGAGLKPTITINADQDFSLAPGQQIRIQGKGSAGRDSAKEKGRWEPPSPSALSTPTESSPLSSFLPPPPSSGTTRRRFNSTGGYSSPSVSDITPLPLLPPPPPAASISSFPPNQDLLDSFLSPSSAFLPDISETHSDVEGTPLISSSFLRSDSRLSDDASRPRSALSNVSDDIWSVSKPEAKTGIWADTVVGNVQTSSHGFDDDADFGDFQ